MLSAGEARHPRPVGPSDESQILAALERFRPRWMALLARFGIPRQDGEDLAQELAIIALLKSGESVSLDLWLLGVGANLCRMYWRKKLRREEPPLDAIPEPVGPLDEDHWIRRIDLDRGLERLPPRQGAVLRLVVAGYPNREIAEQVGYSNAGIRKLIARNVARLARRR